MKKLLLILFIFLGLIGVASNPVLAESALKPMPVVDYVDLDRFMGDWYVIATIPTFLERDAYNPIETYQRDNDEVLQRPSLSIKEV
jgi:apolipoprotein D and lipocalin family protein